MVVIHGVAAGFDVVGGDVVGHDVGGIRGGFFVRPGELAGVFPEGVELGGVGFAFDPALGAVFDELPVEEARPSLDW